MIVLDQVATEQERKRCISDLCSLIFNDSTTFSLPGERVIEGKCPVAGCQTDITRYKVPLSISSTIKLTSTVYPDCGGAFISTVAVAKSWYISSNGCRLNYSTATIAINGSSRSNGITIALNTLNRSLRNDAQRLRTAAYFYAHLFILSIWATSDFVLPLSRNPGPEIPNCRIILLPTY